MIDPYLTGTIATGRQHDNERRIAAAELRRQAKLLCHANGSSDPSAVAVALRFHPLVAIGSIADTCRAIGRGLVSAVGRQASA